jgi:hypothetical protein
MHRLNVIVAPVALSIGQCAIAAEPSGDSMNQLTGPPLIHTPDTIEDGAATLRVGC